MTKSRCIKYIHFVATSNTDIAAAWAGRYATGHYEIDNGAWRDYNPRECRGIEFEFEHDAMTFLHRFGGVYEVRSPAKDAGI